MSYLDDIKEGSFRRGMDTNQYGLPNVNDPDQAFADITRDQYMYFKKEFGDFEENLINTARTDTSLVDQAREDAEIAPALAAGIAQRNTQRYGAGLTPAQIAQRQKNIQLGSTLGSIQSISDAQLAQRDINKKTLGDIINIGQGQYQSALSNLGSASSTHAARAKAFSRDKATHTANTYSTIGAIGTMGIMMMMGF